MRCDNVQKTILCLACDWHLNTQTGSSFIGISVPADKESWSTHNLLQSQTSCSHAQHKLVAGSLLKRSKKITTFGLSKRKVLNANLNQMTFYLQQRQNEKGWSTANENSELFLIHKKEKKYTSFLPYLCTYQQNNAKSLKWRNSLNKDIGTVSQHRLGEKISF